MVSHPQVIRFSLETVAAFIAVVGILSILAQVQKKMPLNCIESLFLEI